MSGYADQRGHDVTWMTAQERNDMTSGEMADLLIEHEQGSTSEEEDIRLFQYLVDTGLAWQLQGYYGRTARDMIEAGLITPPGEGR